MLKKYLKNEKKLLTRAKQYDKIDFADAVKNKNKKTPQSLEKQEKNLDNWTVKQPRKFQIKIGSNPKNEFSKNTSFYNRKMYLKTVSNKD